MSRIMTSYLFLAIFSKAIWPSPAESVENPSCWSVAITSARTEILSSTISAFIFCMNLEQSESSLSCHECQVCVLIKL